MSPDLKQAKERVERELLASLIHEPPMIIHRQGKREQWQGYRLIRRGEDTILLSTTEVGKLAKAAAKPGAMSRALQAVLKRQAAARAKRKPS